MMQAAIESGRRTADAGGILVGIYIGVHVTEDDGGDASLNPPCDNRREEVPNGIFPVGDFRARGLGRASREGM